jgi:uncharacterized coiled-coil protein SlyX
MLVGSLALRRPFGNSKLLKTLFGRIHLGRLPAEQERHRSLLNALHKIMSTQAEIVAQLNAATEQLKANNLRLATINGIVTKVGSETDTLQQRIKDLEAAVANQSGASQELIDASAALKAQSDLQATTVDALEANAKADDDKVPDAPAPTP